MLVLTRMKNESVIINDNITVIIVEIRGDKLRLGIEGPKEMPVHKGEVYDAIVRNRHVRRADEIQQKIDNVRRQLHDLESELSALATTDDEA